MSVSVFSPPCKNTLTKRKYTATAILVTRIEATNPLQSQGCLESAWKSQRFFLSFLFNKERRLGQMCPVQISILTRNFLTFKPQMTGCQPKKKDKGQPVSNYRTYKAVISTEHNKEKTILLA